MARWEHADDSESARKRAENTCRSFSLAGCPDPKRAVEQTQRVVSSVGLCFLSLASPSMKRTLRILSAVLTLAAALAWLVLGANRGWTRTSVPVKTVDEVTGIEGIQYQKKFVPGLELLGGALLGAGILAGASLFFGNQQIKQTKQ